MGVNNLPRVVTQQCAGRELNLQPLDYKSNTLPLHYRATQHVLLTVIFVVMDVLIQFNQYMLPCILRVSNK